MSDNTAPGWPAHRFGLAIFQIVIGYRAVLIYAGRSQKDAKRYMTTEAGRVVFKFKGDVIASSSSNLLVAAATLQQEREWTEAFLAASIAGEADATDPAAFALAPPPRSSAYPI